MARDLVIRNSAELPQAAPAAFEDFVELWLDSDEMFRVRGQSIRSYRKSLTGHSLSPAEEKKKAEENGGELPKRFKKRDNGHKLAFKEWIDAQGIAQPTKQDVKDWCNAMDAAKFSTATKNLRLTTVRNFYKWLSSEYGVANIAEGLKGWKETKEHRRGFLDCSEMKRLLAAVNADTLQGKRDKAILAVMMTAGLRTIEISRLHVGDVQHNGGVCYLEVLGKGRDDTEAVKLSRKAEQLIRDWLAAREAVDIVSDDSPLFCSLSRNSFGEVLSSNSVSTLTKGYLEAAGLKTKAITAHSLRHSMATNSLLKGASLMEVQQQLRHANLSTSQIYLHEAEKSQNRCTDFVADEIL